MSVSRRQLLQFAAATLALGPMRVFSQTGHTGVLGCRADKAGRHWLVGLSADASTLFQVPLPGRGHGIAMHPSTPQCVVFARRPGDWMIGVDLQQGVITHKLRTPADRHVYGHGVFSADGRVLYVCENDFDGGRGVIGLYDANDEYRRLGEFDSHGIGPHELVMLSDGHTLAIANGGIHTHPDTGRAKLNLAEMDPCLSYVDSRDGQLLDAYRPPSRWHHLSIRHLARGADDTLCIGMQYQGSAKQQPPLVALHRGEETLDLVHAPADVQPRMRNYCGSVAVDASGELFAVSSPRGGVLTLWSKDGYQGMAELADGCGLATANEAGAFLFSSGQGGVLRYHQGQLQAWSTADGAWDNHLTAFKL